MTMPTLVKEPIRGPEAFAADGDAAALSQAAILLSLAPSNARPADRALARSTEPARSEVPALEAERMAAFPVPHVAWSGQRLRHRDVGSALRRGFGKPLATQLQRFRAAAPVARPPQVFGELARQAFDDPTPASAAQLLSASMSAHPNALVRVAAAFAYSQCSADYPTRDIVRQLAEGARHSDELTRDVAATALARLAPRHAALAKLEKRGRRRGGRKRSRTSLLVHGTWARSNEWWQPGGSFHSYVKANVKPDLYSASDRFDWTGGYSDVARADAAQGLLAWVSARGLQGLTLFAHSHGGNACLLAGQSGLDAAKVVLLSCPVHVLKYAPNAAHMPDVVSVRVQWDLVILVDGGDQAFPPSSGVRENVLPLWFDHSASHQESVWVDNNVPAML